MSEQEQPAEKTVSLGAVAALVEDIYALATSAEGQAILQEILALVSKFKAKA